jgi:hypothetical protein
MQLELKLMERYGLGDTMLRVSLATGPRPLARRQEQLLVAERIGAKFRQDSLTLSRLKPMVRYGRGVETQIEN